MKNTNYQSSGRISITSTKQELRQGATNLCGYFIHNPNGAESWIQIFAKAATDVTVGTTTPDLTLKMPANGEITWIFPMGKEFGLTNGLTIAATTTETGAVNPSTALTGFVFFT